MRLSIVSVLCLTSLFSGSDAHSHNDTRLPIVDLGYQLHQAISFNSTGQYYNFSNIRYARDPGGELRFTAPQPPLVNRTAVQNGQDGGICPQAFAVWYLCGLAQLAHKINSTDQCNESMLPPPDPLEKEDCLFLDVIVPKAVFENRDKKKAPVMVWVYGGGFAFGKKGGDGNPAGLLEQSKSIDHADQGVIYVQFNYRGGAFGFLNGPSVQENGTANAGLHDQRMALDWVQAQIGKFGGDAHRVTAFGQSAGGGSLLHQITAYGGVDGHAPFQQAILQSPGFPLHPSRYKQENLTQIYLQHLNVSSLEDARQLPYEALYNANVAMVAVSPYGTFTWSPAPDGSFVPGLPSTLLAQGSHYKNISIMTGFNANETLAFTSPANTNDSFFRETLQTTFAGAQPSVLNYIAETLYPPVFNGSEPYNGFFSRAELSLAEPAFTCNTYFLHKALGRQPSYGYRFSIPPAYHGEDVPYTFLNGATDGIYESIAVDLQKYVVSFAIYGQPNTQANVSIPVYGSSGAMVDLTPAGIQPLQDPNRNARCDWWQKALYY